jgi:MFS family permease
MCYKVKEGEYPPLPPKEEKKGWVDSIKSYFSECYGKKYWWVVYLAYAGLYWSYLSNGFTIFFYRDQLGFTVDAYGKLVAYGSMVTLALFYPFGMLMDWWGSHKTLMAGVLSAVIIFLCAFFLIHTPAQGRIFLIITGVPTALSHVTILKWLADVYPPARYGQHNSAAVLFFSIGGVFLGSFCGYLLDLLKDYRYVFVWTAFFRAVTFFSVLWIFYHKPAVVDSISKTDSNLSCGH